MKGFTPYEDMTENDFVKEFQDELPDKFLEDYLRKRHRYFNGQESWQNVCDAYKKTKYYQQALQKTSLINLTY